MSPSCRIDDADLRPAVVGLHYKVGKKIGEGSFGLICEGINILDNKEIAIKFESKKTEIPQLRDEYKTYKALAGCTGIPSVYYYGQEGLYNCLVLDLLGPSLEDLFDLCGRKFSVRTVALLAKQMISRIQAVHEKNFIFRDVKPDNFLIGRKDKSKTIYLVDFGMAKIYRDPKTKQHIPYKEKKSLSGTARYMSINTHLGREQSRRDDLEALGHVFLYFLSGTLPWQGLKAASNKQKYEKIGEKKQSVSIKELCSGYPEAFSTYLTYVRKLGFEETPNYDFLKDCFNSILTDPNMKDPPVFDWVLLSKKRDDKASVKLNQVIGQNTMFSKTVESLVGSNDEIYRGQMAISSTTAQKSLSNTQLNEEQISQMVTMMKQTTTTGGPSGSGQMQPNGGHYPNLHLGDVLAHHQTRHQTSSNKAIFEMVMANGGGLGSKADMTSSGEMIKTHEVKMTDGFIYSSSTGRDHFDGSVDAQHHQEERQRTTKMDGEGKISSSTNNRDARATKSKHMNWFKYCFCNCLKTKSAS